MEIQEIRQENLYQTLFSEIKQIKSLHHIKLQNFKSFKNESIIGPFLNLTSIIGPNGGGKSNIAEAICFACLVNLKNFRSSSYQDLMNKNQKGKNKLISVELNFELQNGDYAQIKRELDQKNHNKYFVNDKLISQNEYDVFLKFHRLIPESHNFLVIQGESDGLVTRGISTIINNVNLIYLKQQQMFN